MGFKNPTEVRLFLLSSPHHLLFVIRALLKLLHFLVSLIIRFGSPSAACEGTGEQTGHQKIQIEFHVHQPKKSLKGKQNGLLAL